MPDQDKLKRLFAEVLEEVPPRFGALKSDVQEHLAIKFAEKCESMGLVSREEFDVQTRVLARTRSKLEALERKLGQQPASQDVAEGSGG